jgi:hypothetical protein
MGYEKADSLGKRMLLSLLYKRDSEKFFLYGVRLMKSATTFFVKFNSQSKKFDIVYVFH